jgi:ubiquinol-cytochrome c reductase iron-sulfur subunit
VNRRNLFGIATSFLSGIAALFAGAPFVRSMMPSARARGLAEPIEVDLSALEPGQVKPYVWRGRTVLVLRRTPAMIDALDEMRGQLRDTSDNSDPPYISSERRSIDPQFLIVEGVCTHLGCIPRLTSAKDGQRAVGNWWSGGFICPCHTSGFDYAGRVVKGPAPTDLPVPPHRFLSPNRVIIGEDTVLS